MFPIIQAAGWPIWFLIVASVIALALIIERSVALRRERILPRRLFNDVVGLVRARQVNEDVINRLEENSPLGRVLAAGLRNESASRELMKESIQEAGRAVSHDLERFLNALGTISTAAPLMGLFGTVIGMIEIFGAQSPTGTNPTQLAHGISVALYNTAFALAVAIPALIFYRHFRRKVDDYVAEMEQHAVRFVDILHQERS